MDHYTEDGMRLVLGSCGNNIKIDASVRIINPGNLYIGSNVRIDANCIIIAGKKITIGNNVHIAHASQLAGGGEEIIIEDFCGISARVNIFTATDDYSEGYLTNPTVPDEYKKVRTGKVILRKHAIIGCGSVIMPNCEIKAGASVGALSLVNKNIPEYTVVSGNPLRVVCKRNKERLIEMERRYLNNERVS